MRNEETPFDRSKYIVATLAMWAGDYRYADLMLQQIASLREFGRLPDFFSSPEQLVQYIGALKRRQIAQRSGEAAKLADIEGVSSEARVIETQHLRGVVTMMNRREFRVHAYLIDLAWRSKLLTNAHELRGQPEGERDDEPEKKHLVGGSWEIPGDPFTRVRVTNLGQIVINAFFASEHPPENYKNNVQPLFESVLSRLDLGANLELLSGISDDWRGRLDGGIALLPYTMQYITETPGRKERFLDTMAGLKKAYALGSTTDEAIDVRTEVAFLSKQTTL